MEKLVDYTRTRTANVQKIMIREHIFSWYLIIN